MLGLARRRMTGGIYFGPPAWVPQRLIDVTRAWSGTRTVGVRAREPQSREELAALLAEAQIARTSPWVAGLREQVEAIAGRDARALVLNLLPPEPESGLVYGLLGPERASVLAGAAAVRRCVPARRVIAVIDRAMPKRRQVMRALRGLGISVRMVLNRYPLAEPTVLLRSVLGVKLPAGAAPGTVGVVMADPIALWALGRAVGGEEFTARPVEVFAFKRAPIWVLAPLGMPVDHLLAALDITPIRRECIRNGMMAGERIEIDSATITATTETLALRPAPRVERPAPCIQCGWCVDHCPTELVPVRLYELALRADGAKHAEAAEAQHCIACGLCSYVCPTRLPLTPSVIDLRSRVRERQSELARAAREVR